MGELVAVVNQKGGVGKTTTAMNLAACLAAADYPTLIVDMDPQMNATSGLGQTGAAGKDTYALLMDECTWREASGSTGSSETTS